MRRLLFVSPRFLFPADEGGKIRTSQVLRGMKGGAFEVTLASPAPPGGTDAHRAEIDSVCDRFVTWDEPTRGPLFGVTRMRHLLSELPIPVATDRNAAAAFVVAAELERKPDVVVVDFIHAAVLVPQASAVPAGGIADGSADRLPVPSVMFTHNVETDIFQRQVEVASDPVRRAVWRNQMRKMEAFERRQLSRFDEVVAVSDRDAEIFRTRFGVRDVSTIPTGVDLDFFAFHPPAEDERVVFTGALDWHANVDGIGWLLEEAWPAVIERRPAARLKVVGRNPPSSLVELGASRRCEFTGFVDDIRPHVEGAAAYVIPLRVGGGTRIKTYEAMAMGAPVVSTSIGVEGLPVHPDEHYLRADGAAEFADALVRLLAERELAQRLARDARSYVEENFSFTRAARAFEEICERAAARG